MVKRLTWELLRVTNRTNPLVERLLKLCSSCLIHLPLYPYIFFIHWDLFVRDGVNGM